jgi:hypothetical protein
LPSSFHLQTSTGGRQESIPQQASLGMTKTAQERG